MGDALDTQAEAERSRIAAEEEPPSGLVAVDPGIVIGRMFASGSFPVLAAAAEAFSEDPEERFAYGLGVVIAGLREPWRSSSGSFRRAVASAAGLTHEVPWRHVQSGFSPPALLLRRRAEETAATTCQS